MSQLITDQLTQVYERWNQNFLYGNLGQVISHCLLGFFLNCVQLGSLHGPDNPSNFFHHGFVKEKLYVKPTPHEWNSWDMIMQICHTILQYKLEITICESIHDKMEVITCYELGTTLHASVLLVWATAYQFMYTLLLWGLINTTRAPESYTFIMRQSSGKCILALTQQ